MPSIFSRIEQLLKPSIGCTLLYHFVKAYQFTAITSVTLLDCWTIPWVIILTRIFIKTKYIFWQIVGVATSIAGLVLVLFSDVSASDGVSAYIFCQFLKAASSRTNAICKQPAITDDGCLNVGHQHLVVVRAMFVNSDSGDCKL
eukprot:Gb_25012 [translate_table: standard]